MKNKVISPVDTEARAKLNFGSGDSIRVWQKIKEKDKFRLQAFEGLVLSRKHGSEAGGTFTVRKVVDGVGVEKTFPLYSPMVDSIEIIKSSKVRRSKLYFVREKATREIRKQMRRVLVRSKEENTDTKQISKEETKTEFVEKADSIPTETK